MPIKLKKIYKDYVSAIFRRSPADQPKLREEIFFWAQAWNRNNVGIWREFGPTRVTFREYFFIGLPVLLS